MRWGAEPFERETNCMNTIKCTNPVCEAAIQVPPGSTYVICPHCNTWHFPTERDFLESEVYSPNALGDLPNYEPAALPAEESHKSGDVEETGRKEARTLGYLVLNDSRKIPLKPGVNSIGRKGCDIIIDDPAVSRRHCVIEVFPKPDDSGWEYTLYDIGHIEENSSTNGVFIRGRSLRLRSDERFSLGKGSEFLLGNVKLILQW